MNTNTKTDTQTTRDLLRTLLNKAHTQGQDDFRENASDSSVMRHGKEFDAAYDAFCGRLDELERENKALREALERLAFAGWQAGWDVSEARAALKRA